VTHFVRLIVLVRLDIAPTEGCFTRNTHDIRHDMQPGGHGPLLWLSLDDIDDSGDEKCTTMLSLEIGGHDAVLEGEVGATRVTSVDTASGEVGFVQEAHGRER